jgi:periplasmic divalent cation tolerance protein
MRKAVQFAIVLVTAPNRTVARRLARAALKERLVACANLVPGIESHYWWQGKIEQGREVLIIFKTTRRRLAALEKLIVANHPYDTPEFLVLTIDAGTGRYLDWLENSTCKIARNQTHSLATPRN